MMFAGSCVLPAIGLAVLFSAIPVVAKGSALEIQSGRATLTLVSGRGRPDAPFGVRLSLGSADYRQPEPIAIFVVDSRGRETWLTGGYGSAAVLRGRFECKGIVATANGSQFLVSDSYTAAPGSQGFLVTRTVTVTHPNASDVGFNSQFSLVPPVATEAGATDIFLPGITYRDNGLPPNALMSHPEDRFRMVREDRLPLPIVMLREHTSGATISLTRVGGSPTTFAGEDGLARVTDARLQFGSLDITDSNRPSPTFLFPGTEGERTYVWGRAKDGRGWALRSHPVHSGVAHRYTLLLRLTQTPDFPAAVRDTWRAAYSLANPKPVTADPYTAYRDGMELLSAVCRPYYGVTAVPFAAVVPGGRVTDTSSQMGFVGQALPSAALLLRYGWEKDDPGAVNRAGAVVDFWAAHSLTPAGLPMTWFDIGTNGTWKFRRYHTFLRVASDGMEGALHAWRTAEAHGESRAEWLRFCRRYGDWLVGAQAPDGSWAREYDVDGRVVNAAPDTTDQAIPFLTDLFFATGDDRYRVAALRAGGFCRGSVDGAYAYVGGTPDNPNVTDKEAGMMAVAAFLSLYDLSSEPTWIAAAARAADYSETWIYCREIPLPKGDPKVVYPQNRSTVGLSLIATGHSGADNYMAAAPFLFYRLSLLTGDSHYRDIAVLLSADTKQMTDWDRSLGYRFPGLLTEALSLSAPRGHGETHWLPWLTVGILEPMTQMKDAFGAFEIAQVEQLPAEERMNREKRFSRDHGFGRLTNAKELQ